MVYSRRQRSRRHHKQRGGEGEELPTELSDGPDISGDSLPSPLTGGRRSRRRYHKQRGGEGEELPTELSNEPDISGDSLPSPLIGGRRSRGGRRSGGSRRSSGGRRSGGSRRSSGGRRSGGKKRGHSGGFLTAVGSVLKDAIVPFMLLYGVNKTRKSRSKRGGDDIA